MLNSEKTAKTVELLALSAAKQLLTVQARFTDAFAAGEMVLPGTMENLLEAQANADLTAKLQTRWNRAGKRGIEDWMVDATEQLIEGNVGGSTSGIQNAREAYERKAMQKALRELNRCADRD